MYDTIIVRYAEIALKGKNRAEFEKKLVKNIEECLRKNKVRFSRIIRKRGRILISGQECDALSRVFGISSFSYATDTDMQGLYKTIDKILSKEDFRTFRVSAKRIDNSVSKKSLQINIEVGQYIVDNFHKKVSLTGHDLNLGIEVLEKKVYVFIHRKQGPCGLPYGINGKAIAEIEDEKSIVAAWLMMKRGIRVLPRGNIDIKALKRYSYGHEMVADQSSDSLPLILGHTLEDIHRVDSERIILRPLVGFSNQEIKQRLKYINE